MTDELASIVRDVIATLALPTTFGIHVHDDAGLAVANSLAAGAGRRPPRAGHHQRLRRALRQRQPGHDLGRPGAQDGPRHGAFGDRPPGLTELSRFVAEVANIVPDAYQPYVGASAFAHKGGVHGAATARVRHSYQHVDPALVGNETRLVVSELGGRVNTQWRAEQLGHELEGVIDPRELSR